MNEKFIADLLKFRTQQSVFLQQFNSVQLAEILGITRRMALNKIRSNNLTPKDYKKIIEKLG